MNNTFYKNDENEVYAYEPEQLYAVERLNELELLIQKIEPAYLAAKENLQHTQSVLGEYLNASHDELTEKERIELNKQIECATVDAENAKSEYNQAESEYQPLKIEYDAVLPVFFDIREKLNFMKKMTAKEVDAHLNPVISKEQLISEAVHKKQLLTNEAAENIAPLQDAIDLEIATEEETTKLKEWKTYRVMLNRVDTSTAPDIVWPIKP